MSTTVSPRFRFRPIAHRSNFRFKVKKGVKRKADTTTPTSSSFDGSGVGGNDYHASGLAPPAPKSAKISTRRESGRQIKKVRANETRPTADRANDSFRSPQPARVPEEGFVGAAPGALSPTMTVGPGASTSAAPQAHHHRRRQKLVREKLSDSLNYCNEILKELFSKKHSVSGGT